MFDESRLTFRVLPNDLDLNLHMNNGRYLTFMDLGRVHLLAQNGLLAHIRRACWMPVLAAAGGTVVIMRTFDPGAALRVIGDVAEGITHFFGVPAPYQFMLQHPEFATTDLSRLQSAGVGGAPCALAILQATVLRRSDLVTLDIHQHLQRDAKGRVFAISVDGSIVVADNVGFPGSPKYRAIAALGLAERHQ